MPEREKRSGEKAGAYIIKHDLDSLECAFLHLSEEIYKLKERVKKLEKESS